MLLHPGTAKRKKVLCIIIKKKTASITYWFSWTLSIWFPLFSFLQYSRPKLFPLDLTLSHLLSIVSSSHFFELWNNKVQLYFNTCYSHHPCIFTCMSIILSFLLQNFHLCQQNPQMCSMLHAWPKPQGCQIPWGQLKRPMSSIFPGSNKISNTSPQEHEQTIHQNSRGNEHCWNWLIPLTKVHTCMMALIDLILLYAINYEISLHKSFFLTP